MSSIVIQLKTDVVHMNKRSMHAAVGLNETVDNMTVNNGPDGLISLPDDAELLKPILFTMNT